MSFRQQLSCFNTSLFFLISYFLFFNYSSTQLIDRDKKSLLQPKITRRLINNNQTLQRLKEKRLISLTVIIVHCQCLISYEAVYVMLLLSKIDIARVLLCKHNDILFLILEATYWELFFIFYVVSTTSQPYPIQKKSIKVFSFMFFSIVGHNPWQNPW